MYERSTNDRTTKKAEEIYPTAEASDTEGVGAKRKRDRSCQEVSDSSPHPVSMEEGTGTWGRNLSNREETQSRSQDKGVRRREQKTKRSLSDSDSRAYVIKKKDELGLTNRIKGSTYSPIQRERIIKEVERLKASGIKKTAVLKSLGVSRSTYYQWLKIKKSIKIRSSVLRLTDKERQAVIEKKKRYPHLSHRKLSGYLRQEGYWISESSCYRILKAMDWISPLSLRQAPWKDAHYEPFAPNQLWGEDWTRLSINGDRYYLLTIIDYFSRYIVAWGIVKRVSQTEVKDLLAIAYMSVRSL